MYKKYKGGICMFWKKSPKDITVTTGKELNEAVKRKEHSIIVQGKLAKKMKWMAMLSAPKIAVLIGALAACTTGTVATGGIAAGPSAAALTMAAGLEGPAIVALVSTCGVSIAIIIAVLKGYNVEIKNDGLLLTLK